MEKPASRTREQPRGGGGSTIARGGTDIEEATFCTSTGIKKLLN